MKNKLIEENMNLVHFLIRKYYPAHIGNEDVIQQGMLGLCQAAGTYKEDKGKFSTYASSAIINKIKTWFRDNSKHYPNLSLNSTVMGADDEPVEAIDLVIGEPDIDFADLTYQRFMEGLSEEERELIDLMQRYKQSELGELLGISQPTVSRRIRELRKKWRTLDEDLH